mmetsp:Transcript_57264/g.139624  ORF Transcript_57264/g.139624 Transcript_57264/m.139624 type:complete len:109 (-) Transcript_57264:2637-2963(-)
MVEPDNVNIQRGVLVFWISESTSSVYDFGNGSGEARVWTNTGGIYIDERSTWIQQTSTVPKFMGCRTLEFVLSTFAAISLIGSDSSSTFQSNQTNTIQKNQGRELDGC